MIVDVDADKNFNVVRHLQLSVMSVRKTFTGSRQICPRPSAQAHLSFSIFYALLIMFEVWLSSLLMIHIY